MAYSNKSYFLTKIKESELNELIKDDNGQPNDDRLTEAIKAADSIINGYIKKAVKTVPIADEKIPENIKLFSYYIATYQLHENIQYEDIPERVKTNYESAISFLRDVSRGLADLDIIEDEAGEELSSGVDYDTEPPIMTSNSF